MSNPLILLALIIVACTLPANSTPVLFGIDPRAACCTAKAPCCR
ncbi:hypothetical protein PTTG_27490 [Puccinia triticina 1-1 BBBD Race 1]|uniref:Uncharacterized protein n=1 Tax=Puccinia triticina (isolate 1-1 / race 1 (BBBD)) TaxID=630390 RepID=A0A180GK30_PUCT1|nr:hypothetical protein PTTG_27490 [Puccinia triticina 1-1 BBBD Race 1]